MGMGLTGRAYSIRLHQQQQEQAMTTCTYIGSNDHNNLQPTCCARAVEGRAYCTEHLYVVYKQGTARARRKKELTTVDKVRMVESLLNEAVAELEAEGFDVYGERELNLDEVGEV
jgi:hypothetical protein